MKGLSSLLIMFLFGCNAYAQGTKAKTLMVKTVAATEAVKVITYKSKPVKTSGGTWTHELGEPASVIQQGEFGGSVVYWRVYVNDFTAIKAKNHLDIHVMQVKDGQESLSYKNAMFVPKKNGWIYAFSEFQEGTYNIYIKDQDNPGDVYSKVSFTVPAKAKTDYKNNSTLVVCRSVDDNWNAIGTTTKIKAGECMNFLFKAKDRVPGTVMTWNVVKVNKEGNEDYVTHLIQGSQGQPFRYMATSEGVCAFPTPGKYRVYLFMRDDYDTGIKRGEDSNFLQKVEITVE